MLKYILAASIALCATSAFAAPPAVGETFSGTGFLCDTEAQVKALFDAAQDKAQDSMALVKAYTALNSEKNAKGEPSCLFSQAANLSVTKVVHLGMAYGRGHVFDTWMINIKADDITGSILYSEATPSEAPKS